MAQGDPQPASTVAPPEVIATPDALCDLASRLRHEPRIAVDTEANSLYAYHERVCLIQISTPDANYLVDPLTLDDLSLLAPIFASPDIEKVFHAADYDLIMLRRDFGFSCSALFDTMWAARILGWPHVGLGDILAETFNVHLDKRYQRYNWGKRPIEAGALTYAWMDSYYLLALREVQKQALIAAGRWEEAQEIFAYLCQTPYAPSNSHPDDSFWRIKGVHDLQPDEQQVLYRLHLWRDKTAQAMDRPAVKVISNEQLIRLAQVQPRSREELPAASLTPYQVRRFGNGILKALYAAPLPLPPLPCNHGRPSQEVLDRYNNLKAWRKEVAACRGVDSDVILPNAVLWELARHPPTTLEQLRDIPGIGPWRQATYGPDLLRIVKGSS
ncbi:MAG TPA: HRDC domain-containing protein [Anaerolineae bacterium]|nr:HRDC domain-containing protein [Anaerolineae bacterium]HQK14903.1 HRDC domain-containing protein [Anaerolineae bacterium]